MNHLPVIIGFGGVNPAGRISFHHAYRRLVIDRLNQAKQDRTYLSLAQMMGLAEDPAGARDPVIRQNILDHTLIRRIEHFDSDRVVWQSSAKLKGANEAALTFVISKRQLPQSIPPTWRINELNDREVQVTCDETLTTLLPEERVSKVSSAGQLPTGFEPGAQYPARQHPRALQMSVCGASDALRSTGFDIQALKDLVRPDQLAVYSGSAMGQLDSESYGGLLQNPLTGRRPTSKQAALGLPEMAGDFVNAYVLGSVGETAGIIGACATFLYNVKRGMDDIRSGAKKIVVIGNSEAPITPYVIEGYRTMGALAEDDVLCGLDNTTVVDNRRACRPFSSNAGFTVAEASVWMVMMADDLAMQTGARILGSVGDVHINADGYKKSISGPGIGNYLTVAKALSSARSMVGEDTVKQGSYMQAHGTGTPQNRVTESQIFNELAQSFGISNWLTGAVKCYLGHSMAPAGGDQLSAVLGAWVDGWVPGIRTIDHIADDVHHSHLNLPMDHVEIDPAAMPLAFVNSKGFGGNNATGVFLSPMQTTEMLRKRWGEKAITQYQNSNELIESQAQAYDDHADDGTVAPVYHFGEGVLDIGDLSLSENQIKIPGFSQAVDLNLENPFEDMC